MDITVKKVIKSLLENKVNLILEKVESDPDLQSKLDQDVIGLLKDPEIPEEEKIDLLFSTIIERNLGDNDIKDCILEIKVGVGGSESEYFNYYLFSEYLKICKTLKIPVEIEDVIFSDGSELNSLKFARLKLEKTYFLFKFENGKHRLIEMSPFKKSERRHTTTSIVEIYPFFEVDEIKLNKKDLKIETMKSSGHGGQYVNKTESAVRVTHIPTGITVTCQSERSQHQNRKLALSILISKLTYLEQEKQMEKLQEIHSLNKNIYFSKFSNYIRTYYFSEDKVIQHVPRKLLLPLKNAILNIMVHNFIDSFLLSRKEEEEK